MIDETALPIIQSDWVARRHFCSDCKVARVRQSYRDRDGNVYMDIVMYNNDGQAVGRESPAMGGPRRFEPAVAWDPEEWTRIEKPSFPIHNVWAFRDDPERPGTKVAGYSIYKDSHNHNGVGVKAIRTTTALQSRDRSARFKLPIKEAPSNGKDVDAAAMRRAAQELRDMAKHASVGSDTAAAMKERANALEMEAMELLK